MKNKYLLSPERLKTQRTLSAKNNPNNKNALAVHKSVSILIKHSLTYNNKSSKLEYIISVLKSYDLMNTSRILNNIKNDKNTSNLNKMIRLNFINKYHEYKELDVLITSMIFQIVSAEVERIKSEFSTPSRHDNNIKTLK